VLFVCTWGVTRLYVHAGSSRSPRHTYTLLAREVLPLGSHDFPFRPPAAALLFRPVSMVSSLSSHHVGLGIRFAHIPSDVEPADVVLSPTTVTEGLRGTIVICDRLVAPGPPSSGPSTSASANWVLGQVTSSLAPRPAGSECTPPSRMRYRGLGIGPYELEMLSPEADVTAI